MRVAFMIESVSRLGGGLVEVLRPLAQNLHGSGGVGVDVLGLVDRHSVQDLPGWYPLEPETFAVRGPRSFGYAPGLASRVAALAPDVVHSHGLWKYHSVVAAGWGNRTGKPYLVSPHGMLDPWALGNSRWKKVLSGHLFENRHLRNAACIQALCDSEAESIRRCGWRNPLCLIPNGIDLPGEGSYPVPRWVQEQARGRKILLYLGRIHPKKGLTNLVEAWRLLRLDQGRQLDGWLLAIAGWGQGECESELKKQVQDAGLADDILFIGPQFGAAKSAAYHAASAFILPSFSEGLPMVVLEAWAFGLPVLMTPECNIPEGYARGASLGIRTDPGDIARGIRELMAMAPGERQTMGLNGYRLVEERFTWSQVAGEIQAVYGWLLGGGTPPASVRFI
jgi:glycosyltransferase involved in cell wall biosynthesis